MIRKEDLEQRLQDLGWTLYKLAKQFSEIRAVGGEVSPATRYHTSIGKAMENPAKSRLETIEGIVQALNGEITIVWDSKRSVTVRIDEKLMEALNERAKNDGFTIVEVAEQLLLQALSGASTQQRKKQTAIALGSSTQVRRTFHPCVASAYTAVHEWLGVRPQTEGYRKLNYSEDISRSLDQADIKSVAFQHYALFPKQYFEAAQILENVVSSARLISWLRHNPHICVVDVGSTMGAASAAFIGELLTLKERKKELQSIEISCLSIDPNIYGATLYSKLMQEIKHNASYLGINLEFQTLCERIPKAIIPTIRHLQRKREQWGKPYLSNVFIMQLDITSSLSQANTLKQEQYDKLQELDVELDFLIEDDEEFGQEEALAYKQLFEGVPIDYMHVTTIGTKNLERHTQKILNSKSLEERLQDILNSFYQVFGSSHRINVVTKGLQQVHFENPIGSYWRDRNEQQYFSSFYAHFCTVASATLEEDKDWSDVISIENLELAWVRARRNLLTIESFYDEVELRLFEKNLYNNLIIMQQQLNSYYEDVIPPNEEIPYNFIKSESSTRLKQLSRLEEEILSIAIIQKLGRKAGFQPESHVYAYRLSGESYGHDTEYLYESWWDGYKRFIQEAHKSADEYEHGAVIHTDIKNYYPTIIQKQLLEITDDRLNITSERIRWLLRKIILNDLHRHEPGLGLSQGTITSGFYANLYLSSVDARFSSDKKWKVKFHRYVDDMILVVPNSTFIKDVCSALENQLDELGLKLSEDKTEVYTDTFEFKRQTSEEPLLTDLGIEFNRIINPLWIMNSKYRAEFEFAYKTDDIWWSLIARYQQCLHSINVYFTKSEVSRSIYRRIFNFKQHDKNSSKVKELKLPPFPIADDFVSISAWAVCFEDAEMKWFEAKKELRVKLIGLFQESRKQLQNNQASGRSSERRKFEKRIRFATSKLSVLGFTGVSEEVTSTLCEQSFVIRDPLSVVKSLARQGYTAAIEKVMECYQKREHETSQYMRAVALESMRFLPSLGASNWELIFNYATGDNSVIEKLKATETWLFLGKAALRFVKDKHIDAVVEALNGNPPSRLQKNYILILGMCRPESISNFYISDKNYMLDVALEIALEGNPSELFEEYEPAIVRQYYSGQRAVNTDEEREIPT